MILKETAIYIHIPFCNHKCIYCDFYSIITTDNIDSYRKGLLKEIDIYSSKYSEGREIISIYFGGGTPSLMTPGYIREIIDHVKKKFFVRSDAEITLETNPGTVNRNKLDEFKAAGINRISIGIQSFHQNDLKFMTRIHDPETAIRTVNDAAQIGFENISIDLIFNLPGQTKNMWKFNLDSAMDLPIKHLSAYSLILESGTILNKMVLDGKVTLQDDDYDADLYEFTIQYLNGNGFQQYEVSNFSKPGFECIHNNVYWQYKDYLGFGTSAHSFTKNKRWKNFSSLKFYLEAINKKNSAITHCEILNEEEMTAEYTMLALRSYGLNKKELNKKFGSNWLDINREFFNLLNQNRLIMEDEYFIRFTPRGYAVCDEILAKLK